MVQPPSAKPAQNTPIIGTIFQKNRSLQLSIPGHSSAPSISQSLGGEAGALQHHQLCRHLHQADSQAASSADLSDPLLAEVSPPTDFQTSWQTSCLTADPMALPSPDLQPTLI